MIKRQILERVLALLDIASTDATRHHLSQVVIESTLVKKENPNQVILSVTNGHMMVREILALECPLGRFSFYQGNKSALALLLREWKHDEIEATITENGLLVGHSMKILFPKGTSEGYPDLVSIIPKPFEQRVGIGINAKYLMMMAKALGTQKKKEGIFLEFDPLNLGGPVVVRSLDREFSEQNYKALVMPMRTEFSKEIEEENNRTYADAILNRARELNEELKSG